MIRGWWVEIEEIVCAGDGKVFVLGRSLILVFGRLHGRAVQSVIRKCGLSD